MLKVTISKEDGTVLFVGIVPDDDVMINREINKPTTAVLRMPLRDMEWSLTTLTTQEIAADYADSAE